MSQKKWHFNLHSWIQAGALLPFRSVFLSDWSFAVHLCFAFKIVHKNFQKYASRLFFDCFIFWRVTWLDKKFNIYSPNLSGSSQWFQILKENWWLSLKLVTTKSKTNSKIFPGEIKIKYTARKKKPRTRPM